MARRTLTSTRPLFAVLRAALLLVVLAGTFLIGSGRLVRSIETRDRLALQALVEATAESLVGTPVAERAERLRVLSEVTDVTLTLGAARAPAESDPKVLVATAPVPDTTERVTGRRATPPTADQLSGTLTVIGRVGTALGLLYLLLVYWRANRDRREIRTLVDGAGRFARGDLRYRITPTGEVEWDRLAVSMNRMARQLSDQLQTLQAQRAQQRAILESLGSSVIALDRDHRLLSANRAAETLFGLEESTRGRLLQEVLQEPGLHRMVEKVLQSGARESLETESATLAGKRLSIIVEPLQDADGSSMGVVVLLDDVTDIRRLERMRSDFAANVSHELRTPITSIQGYVETLQEVALSDEEQTRRFLDIIRRNAERLGVIIEDLLTLARLEQPDAGDETEMAPRRVVELLEEVLERQRPPALERRVELVVDCDSSLMILTRGDLMAEAIGNLVSNAVRYGPEASEVGISVRITGEADDLLEFRITDQGPGIPERHVPRLFERFYRVDKARSREAGGTGLGLAIVKHIALVHGGKVSVETEVGVGSTFSLLIPMANPQPVNSI